MSWTLITSTAKASSNGTDVTSDAFDSTGGDTVVVVISTSSGVDPTPTDNKGNTGNYVGGTAVEVGGGERVRIFIAKNATCGAGHTVTLNPVGALPAIDVFVFSGGHTTAPADQESAGASTFATTLQPGSLTPSEGNELVIAALAFNVAGTISIDGAYSGNIVQANQSGTSKGAAASFSIQTTAAATNPTFTNTNTSSMASIAQSFKSAAGGGGGGGGSNWGRFLGQQQNRIVDIS